jgi:uncharacterized YigZ family protein
LKDTFKTIETACEALLKEKGSKFLAFAFPIGSEQDVMTQLQILRKIHSKANHHCYAWRIGLDEHLYRANDDGEPSGTAGKPILGQIDSLGLTNVALIVVRYFGGTLLGTSGLIQAYRAAAADALAQATIVEKIVEDYFELRFQYDIMPDVMNALKKVNLHVLSQTFEQEGIIRISIRKSETQNALLSFKAAVLKMPLTQAILQETIAGLEIITL